LETVSGKIFRSCFFFGEKSIKLGKQKNCRRLFVEFE
jgi:hypothetical protein